MLLHGLNIMTIFPVAVQVSLHKLNIWIFHSVVLQPETTSVKKIRKLKQRLFDFFLL